MTRTDADAKSMTIRPSRSRTSLRGLLAVPVALALVAAFVTPALAATGTNPGLSGYTNTSTGKQETLPSKSKTAPQSESKPTSTTPTATPAPTTTSVPAKASSLPFTGLDLRWVVGFGLLLMATGGSIVTVQRRQRGGGGR